MRSAVNARTPGSAAVGLSLIAPDGTARTPLPPSLHWAALDAGRLPVLIGADDATTAAAGDAAGFLDRGWSRLSLSPSPTDTPTHKESS